MSAPRTDKFPTLPPWVLLAMVYLAFVSLGLPDGLLGVAWPGMREDFALQLDAVGALLVAATSGYLISSFGSAWLLRRMGIGRLLFLSASLTVISLAGYGLSPAWLPFLPLAFLGGLGAGGIDAGLNHYVESRFDHSVMQWMHASYGIGVTGGPLLMTWAIASLNGWRTGYLIVGGIQIVLTLGFLFMIPHWDIPKQSPEAPTEETPDRTAREVPMRESLGTLQPWLSSMLFLCYVGVEAGLGVWSYTLLTEGKNIPHAQAGLWVGAYWGSFTVGRILSGFLSARLSPKNLLRGGIAGASIGIVMLLQNQLPSLTLPALCLTGFALAPMFAALMSTTSQRVGRQHTANTIALQISFAGAGGGLLPGAIGWLAARTDVSLIPLWLLALLAGVALLLRIRPVNNL